MVWLNSRFSKEVCLKQLFHKVVLKLLHYTSVKFLIFFRGKYISLNYLLENLPSSQFLQPTYNHHSNQYQPPSHTTSGIMSPLTAKQKRKH